MENELANRPCIPCLGGVSALKGDDVKRLLARLDGAWTVVAEHHLERNYRFENFRRALDFTVRVGELAEAEGHHPDIFLAWGRVAVTIFTHKIDGLTESDFILAAKIDQLFPS
jgi:4a-hydroxytetrahydrobiopterin dehydratase